MKYRPTKQSPRVRCQQVDSCRLDDPAESGRSARENISLKRRVLSTSSSWSPLVASEGPTLRHGLLIWCLLWIGLGSCVAGAVGDRKRHL
jgi:hypothetical protein